MFITRKDAAGLIANTLTATVGELKEKSDFLLDLLQQDDWSFVIKAHALVEAAVTQMLLDNVSDARLASFIQRLQLGGQFGKIALTRELGLLTDEHRMFTNWFSRLRNALVHDLKKISFGFENHLRDLSTEQRNDWTNSIVWFSKDNRETRRLWRKIATDQPKIALFMGVFLLVSECVVSRRHSDAIRRLRAIADQTTKSLLAARKRPTKRAISGRKRPA